MTKVQTPFSYEQYGLRFPNYFQIKMPDFNLPVFGKIDLQDVVYGLCGGMCFTALDYFYQNTPPPTDQHPDQLNNHLFTYLRDRQMDSMQVLSLIKIMEWMATSDDQLAARMLKSEIPALIKSINKGQPVVLCLIRAAHGGDMTHNHQVLATGYEIDDFARQITITLYDPNHPYDPDHPQPAPTITARLTRKDFAISQSTGEPLRGFFRMNYKTQKKLPVQVEAEPGDAPVEFEPDPEPADLETTPPID